MSRFAQAMAVICALLLPTLCAAQEKKKEEKKTVRDKAALDLLTACVDALGGTDQVSKWSTMHVKYTLRFSKNPDNFNPMEVEYHERPGYSRWVARRPGDKTILVQTPSDLYIVSNGEEVKLNEAALRVRKMGISTAVPKGLLPVLRDEQYAVELVDPVEVHTTSCLGVKVRHPDFDGRNVLMYFHKENKLLVRYVVTGDDGKTEEIHSYREFNKVKYPAEKDIFQDDKLLYTQLVESVEFVDKLDDKLFEKP